MNSAERLRFEARSRKVERVLSAFRRAISTDELDKNDWESLRVAVRLVYETEDLRLLLHSNRLIERDYVISYWTDSMEAGLEFMSWTKCLAGIVRVQTYSSQREDSVEGLWERHRALATRLLAARMSPERRLSLLVELGGIELSLLGHLWWLAPSKDAPAPGRAKNGAQTTGQRRKKKLPRGKKAKRSSSVRRPQRRVATRTSRQRRRR